MNVCFFRHGPAVSSGTPGIADGERPLTPDGKKRTAQAARGLQRLNLGLDLIVSSPLPRALQTAEILSEVLGLPRPRHSDLLLPETPARRLLELLRETEAAAPVFVGHEPSIGKALGLLVAGSPSSPFQMKKAGMAFVEIRKHAPTPRGLLLLLLTPSALRKLRGSP